MLPETPLYLDVPHFPLKATPFQEYRKDLLPQGMPFSPDLLNVMSFAGEVLDYNMDPDDSETYIGRLVKISKHHGRAFEMVFGDTNGVVWTDEFGNLFKSLNIKGNNFTNPMPIRNDRFGTQYMVVGLQESNSIDRILTVSHYMRSKGIDTEAIVEVVKPDEIECYGNWFSQDEFKSLLLEMLWVEKSTEVERSPYSDFHKVPRDQMSEYAKFLEENDFIFTLRAQQVGERIADLAEAKSEDEFKRIMKSTFDFVNLRESIKVKNDPNYTPRFYDVDNQLDIDWYLNIELPKLMGRNLGLMHQAGLAHRSPNAQNISMVGSIYDADCIIGEPLGLGDDPISLTDIREDYMMIRSCFDTLSRISARWTTNFYALAAELQTISWFLDSYQRVQGFASDDLLGLAVMRWMGFSEAYEEEGIKKFRTAFQKSLGWYYAPDVDTNALLEEFEWNDGGIGEYEEKFLELMTEKMLADFMTKRKLPEEVIQRYGPLVGDTIVAALLVDAQMILVENYDYEILEEKFEKTGRDRRGAKKDESDAGLPRDRIQDFLGELNILVQ